MTDPQRPRVLDASAVLAMLGAEPGAEAVADHVASGGACLSAVNLAEIATVLTRTGRDVSAVVGLLLAQLDVAAYDTGDALATAALEPACRAAGLSLGDRACLALAAARDTAAVTADRAWVGLGHGVTVEVIRPDRAG